MVSSIVASLKTGKVFHMFIIDLSSAITSWHPVASYAQLHGLLIACGVDVDCKNKFKSVHAIYMSI